MNDCPDCGKPLILLQENLRKAGFINAPSDRTGELRGCKGCDITFYYGSTRADQQEHWMRTPYKCHEFSRANTDWDAAWRETDS